MGTKPPGSQTRLSFLSGTSEQSSERGEAPSVPNQTPQDEHRDTAARSGPRVYTVSQIVRGANRLLEARFTNIWVEGEVVGLKVGSSGHAYFTLKDAGGQVPAAMWRSSVERLKFRIEDGQVLRVFGRLGIFAKQGRFQFYVDRAEPAGLGALMLELEQRKAKLAEEGLFDPERKRPLPKWPRLVGVVTSAHGAAVHDILKVARRRCPSHILVSPAVVQGPEAPFAVVRALRRLYRWPGVDVIIVARGGGAMEDLWGFNDEDVVRQMSKSPVPIVSGVGHEVDVTLADLVADVRAATPSHAAELVVPDRAALVERLDALQRRMVRAVERQAIEDRTRLDALASGLAAAGRALATARRRRLAELEQRLRPHHPRDRVGRDRKRLRQLSEQLAAAGRRLPREDRRQLTALMARMHRRGQALPVQGRARLSELAARMESAGRSLPRAMRLRLARAAASLEALSPLSVLTRGYAVVTDADGRAVTDAAKVEPGDAIGIRLGRGKLDAEVKATHPEEDADS